VGVYRSDGIPKEGCGRRTKKGKEGGQKEGKMTIVGGRRDHEYPHPLTPLLFHHSSL